MLEATKQGIAVARGRDTERDRKHLAQAAVDSHGIGIAAAPDVAAHQPLVELLSKVIRVDAALIQAGRGSKLTGPESALFSGEYWSGEQAHQHGLVDGFGEIRSFMRARFGEKVYLPLIADRGWFGRRIPGVGSQLAAGLVAGDGVAADVLSVAEQRAVWARCGL